MAETYDLLSPAHFAAPHQTFALMRENDPLYWHEQMGLWFVTRYRDVHTITRDRRFSAAASRIASWAIRGVTSLPVHVG